MTVPRLRLRHQVNSRDTGFSLIELIIVVSLIAIVSLLVTPMFVNTIDTQNTVVTVTEATTKGQVVQQTLDPAIRSAEAVRVSPDGTRLDVKTVDGVCAAWRVDSGVLSYTSASGGSPVAADPASWGSLLGNVVDLPGSSGVFATALGSGVTYEFRVTTESAPVDFDSTVRARNTLESDGTPCW